jgi:hypothetical protein
MTVYYVAKTGNDSNAGTSQSAPKLTIEAACNLADDSEDNVVEIIDSGVYSEGDIDIFSYPITVRATGSNKPIMDGDSGNDDYAFVPYISGNVFQGLHMRNYDDGLVGVSNANAKSFILSGCIGHFLGGPQSIGNTSTPTQHAEVNQCLILAEGNAAFSCGNGKVWFNNSVIATNKVGYAALSSAQSNANITASFCTFIGSGLNNSSGRSYNIVNQVYKVINCIVSGSGDGINANDSTYNLVNVSGDPFIAWSSDSYDGTPRSANTGEITGDPLFISGSQPGTASPAVDGNVHFDTQWFQLTAGSPADGAGTTYGGVSADISGSVRTIPRDIGAYAFFQEWTDWTDEPEKKFSGGLDINHWKNLASNTKFRYNEDAKQAPFSLGIKGPSTLRGRTKVHKTTK